MRMTLDTLDTGLTLDGCLSWTCQKECVYLWFLLIVSDVLQEQLWYACTSSSLSEVANVPRTEVANVPRKLPQVDKSWRSAC